MPNEGTSRKLEHTHLYLRSRIPLIQKDYKEETGLDLIITCTFRDENVQYELWLQGRKKPGPIVTQIDGKTRKSKHNMRDKNGKPQARAVDFCVDLDPDMTKIKVSWDWRKYVPLIKIAKKHGLVSGGSWKNFKDWPHVEMPNSIA